MGDLSRNHATLTRNGEGYLLQAHRASFVNGKPVVQALVEDARRCCLRGVRYQVAPSKRSSRACSTPAVSAPASG